MGYRVAPKYKGNNWTNVPIKQRVDPKALDQVYELAYGLMGSESSHSGAGVVTGLHQPHDFVIQVPTNALVLYVACLFYCAIITRTTEHFQLQQEDITAAAAELGVPMSDPVITREMAAAARAKESTA